MGYPRGAKPEVEEYSPSRAAPRRYPQRAPWRFLAVAPAALSSVGMLLAGMGIFGSLAHSVAQRVREIGVRVSLGARPPRIAWLIPSEGIAVASLGICAGLWLGLASVRALSGLLFRVSPFDVATPLALAAFLGRSRCWRVSSRSGAPFVSA